MSLEDPFFVVKELVIAHMNHPICLFPAFRHVTLSSNSEAMKTNVFNDLLLLLFRFSLNAERF